LEVLELNELTERNKQTAHRDEAGFTLLETSISMVLLAIAGLGVASCFFFAASNNTSARDRELSMGVAQQQMEQLRNVAFTDGSLSARSGQQSTLYRAGRRYTVQTTITNGTVVNGNVTSKNIQIKVTPWSDGARWAREVSSVFGSVTMVATRTAQTVGPNRQ
jgi:prepilin-type N-terminal cleavage/methylation domain-containing protein